MKPVKALFFDLNGALLDGSGIQEVILAHRSRNGLRDHCPILY